MLPESGRDMHDLSGDQAEQNVEAFEAQVKMLRDKILFGLNIYPALSPSMLHVFVGTATPKDIWKDIVLQRLLDEGLVVKDEVTLTSPHERTQTYTILYRSDKTYTKPIQPIHTDNTTEEADNI